MNITQLAGNFTKLRTFLAYAVIGLALAACAQQSEDNPSTVEKVGQTYPDPAATYASFTLTADLSSLSDKQKQMIGLLIEASEIMDELFWLQSYGDKTELLNSIANTNLRRMVEINYGPWDRLNGDALLTPSHQSKPLGARFYPEDITKAEIENTADPSVRDLYTLVKRDPEGQLTAVPFSRAYRPQLEKASQLLQQAATLAEDAGFKTYLQLRAAALLDDNYQPSDIAWMDMKNNSIDVVIGPIETYEDRLFGYKAAYESYVLIKDQAWSEKLARFAKLLPELQKGLPVEPHFKAETPGTDSDLNAYDVVYYAGHSNAGSKTIAINLPNDETVQLEKGTRRLQLRNAMQAKFDKIMLPIAEQIVAPEQRKYVTFNAFFSNVMFHEVAHGLGIKNTINGSGTVREALKDHASAQEEGKADILGLYMIEELLKAGEITEGELMDYYTTFLAGIFRSSRFGASSAHGVANVLRFNYFADQGAFAYDQAAGHYRVEPEKMRAAVQSMSAKILTLQGNGDYAGVEAWVKASGSVSPALQKSLDKINNAGIPVDIVFEQGKRVLGL
ncbi:MAG: dipeptidyl-peptidase 3 family protein [Pseudomonadales bacterium]